MLETMSVDQMRERFKAIPQDIRDAHQPFSIRVWRGLSWLERVEGAGDVEGRFISLWIAFNAIYGRLDEDGRGIKDRVTWQAFMTRVVERDVDDRLGRIVRQCQPVILSIINSPYVFRPFWFEDPQWSDKLNTARRQALLNYHKGHTLAILQELFERLYVIRSQVFHGAATCGSRLNRELLAQCTDCLGHIVPTVVTILLDAGPKVQWGEVCYPPVPTR